ncbi:MAG: DNA/RNA nuclease SfsA [Nitrososphaerota archaeon]|jgi:sugar fermentation stimulation protein A|nr:DNA/RNA nuclease SfsA [Nitrososphaerota archaeon]MDG6903267.1 DNA/RNA nuclease SfsA [Nitrososphaerota archaeon]MDG6911872.1 DNA/RNA nuclease SfsA [Nitrososphaerota archaeon]MDG6940647.1 DNA/RNA nuclease SfsA [Nitrososphaerota archaeon]MDG6960957.1 DNA/RNA nuclease SfsA [Nitrososphaerota archaeon]
MRFTATFRFPRRLDEGRVLSRPNRFIMMVGAGGRTLRCHCPTTGRLGDLKLDGLPCLYSTAENPGRKTAHTVEAISISRSERKWVGINQTAANRYFEFFLRNGSLSKLATGEVRREVRLGESRIDFLVGDTYVEVKTPLISLPAGPREARVQRSRFDSFDRLIRHMSELRGSLAQGKQAKIVLCYLYDAAPFNPPPQDGTNAGILAAARSAEEAGVERWQVNMKMTAEGVSLIRYFRSRPYTGGTD